QIYEGGHRVPLVVRWPEQVVPGAVSKETVCLSDFFATFAGLLKQSIPEAAGEDSVDIMDVLLGRKFRKPIREATVHHSVAGQFALRKGDWKLIEGGGDGDYPRKPKGGIDVQSRRLERDPASGAWTRLDYFRLKPDGAYQLYNLKKDPAEKNDMATKNPEMVASLSALLNQYRDRGRSVSYMAVGSTRGIIDSKRPAEATQLVGHDRSVFVPESDSPSRWSFQDGVLTASPQWDSVITPDVYNDFRLHLEFNVNDRPGVAAEKNGNSGVYIQQRYEVQILNSFGIAESDYTASYCGSLYRQKKPDQLVCKPAGEWQSYDIVFRAARFEDEQRVANARITVYQNGTLIHDDYALRGKTGAGRKEGPEPGPIKLQGHQNQVRFRNVWIQKLNLD
ncbi:MAG: family 16 glycoside hydrolase, partial [Verrucomicrobiota bacterium]